MSIDKISGSGLSFNAPNVQITIEQPENLEELIRNGRFRMFNARDLNGDGFLSADEVNKISNPIAKDAQYGRIIPTPYEAISEDKTSVEDTKKAIRTAEQISKQLKGEENSTQKIPPEQLLPKLDDLGKAHQSVKQLIEEMQNDNDLSVTA